MYEVYCHGMCLVPPSNGAFKIPNRNRLQRSGCGQRLTTVGDTASPSRHAEASPLDANQHGHLSEDDYTAGSQPYLMQ